MYRPGLLPVPNSDDLTLNVRQFHALWVETLRIVDGMRAAPALTSPLRLSIDSLRVHAQTVLASVNQFLRSGGATVDDAYEIPAVHDSIQLFQQELLRTKALWDAWATNSSVSFSAVQRDPKSEQAVIDTLKPRSNVESVIFLAGGALVIGALMLMKK